MVFVWFGLWLPANIDNAASKTISHHYLHLMPHLQCLVLYLSCSRTPPHWLIKCRSWPLDPASRPCEHAAGPTKMSARPRLIDSFVQKGEAGPCRGTPGGTAGARRLRQPRLARRHNCSYMTSDEHICRRHRRPVSRATVEVPDRISWWPRRRSRDRDKNVPN